MYSKMPTKPKICIFFRFGLPTTICFLSFICENTHKVRYKIEIDMLMIFDLFTSPQGHQSDPRMKMLLAYSVLLVIPVDLICHMTMYDFLDPWAPQCPKFPPLGHGPGNRIKIPSDMFCIFHL